MILSSNEPIQIAPQALAERTPSLTNSWNYAQQGVAIPRGLDANGDVQYRLAVYSAIYKANPTISALVDKVANSVSRLDLRLWDESDPAGRVELSPADNAYAKILSDPSAQMDRYSFWQWVVSTYEIYGEVFLAKVRGADGRPYSLLPLHPSNVTVRRGEDGSVEYVWNMGLSSSLGPLALSSEDVIPIRRYNPDGMMRGLSRLDSLRITLSNEDAANRANVSFWERGARPSAVIKRSDQLDRDTAERLQRVFRGLHQGAENMGGVPILDAGMELQTFQLSLEEMQYIESRKFNQAQACTQYDVPPPVIHILDKATFSNITEQMRSMYRDTMTPRLCEYEAALDKYLRPEFGDDTLSARFDLDAVLRGDFETRATAASSLVANGIWKPSEARSQLFELPDAGSDADRLYANQAMQPLGLPITRTSITEPVTPQEDPIPEDLAHTDRPSPLARDNAPAGTASTLSVDRRVLGMKGRIQAKRDRDQMLTEAQSHATRAVKPILSRQAARIRHKAATVPLDPSRKPDDVSSDLFDSQEWDDELQEAVQPVMSATVGAFATLTAASLGGSFNQALVANWLAVHAMHSAQNINAATQDGLVRVIETAQSSPDGSVPDAIANFADNLEDARVDQIASTLSGSCANFGDHEGASQSGAETKTWITGDNPRPEHADVNGETVGIDDTFSNGLKYPGDPSADTSQTANCNCALDFGRDQEADSDLGDQDEPDAIDD